MSGPCTLLVEPTKQTYTDAAGVHVLPWHGTPMIKRRAEQVEGNSFFFPEDYKEKWALSIRQHPAFAPVSFTDAISPDTATTQAKFSATNATKTFGFIPTELAFLMSSWPDFADQQFWEILGLQYAHGSGHAGTQFCVKVVSTGGDLDVYETANANSYDLLANLDRIGYFAVVVNGNNANRPVRFLRNTTELKPVRYTSLGGPDYLGPYEYAHLIYDESHSSTRRFDAGQSIGVRFLDTEIGDVFYLLMLSVIGSKGGPGLVSPVVPLVHTTTSDIPDTYWYDPNTLNPITIFSGDAWVSQARMGETFWRCPITAEHIPDDTRFTVASKTKEMFSPNPYSTCLWAICRAETIATDASEGTHLQAQMSTDYMVREFRAEGYNKVSDDGFAKTDNALASVAGQYQRSKLPDVSAVTVDGEYMSVVANDGAGAPVLLEEIVPGWMELDNDALETMHLFPGATFLRSHPQLGWATGTGSSVMSREHAIFSRPLTDTEYAYLNDPDAVWSLNMFSPPTTATVTGLDAPLYRGDDRTVTITVKDADGDAVPLYGCSVWFIVKSAGDVRADDLNALISDTVEFGPDGSASVGSGITAIDLATGSVQADFTCPLGACKYDVQIKDINGKIRTVASGSFTGNSDVTRATTVD